MSSRLRRTLPLAFLCLTAATANAQTTVGLQPFGSYTKGFDQINLQDLAIHIDIPLFYHKARGTSMGTFVHLLYDSGYYYKNTTGPDVGWRVVSGSAGAGGQVWAQSQTVNCPPRTDGENPGTYQLWTWRFIDSTGYTHNFAGTTTYTGCTQASNNPDPTTSLTEMATDGSGYLLNATGYTAVVTDPGGTQYSYTSFTIVIDSNGNVAYAQALQDNSNVTVTMSGGYYLTNSSGVPTSREPLLLKYTDTSGNSQTIQVAYRMYGVGTAAPAGLVNTVTFPDQSAYQFGYQGEGLSSVELPTGAPLPTATPGRREHQRKAVRRRLAQ